MTVHYGAEITVPVVVRDARANDIDHRTVQGVEIVIKPSKMDGIDILVAGGQKNERLSKVIDEVVRRIEYDAAMDAYYRAAATGGATAVDMRPYLRDLERNLEDAAIEVAAEGFPA